ncbi:MAG TPA: alpha/beta hydrolase [Ktedonobacterales bacterium]|nr:alpha/beta hydrolase [Ktedonobacterales bacterium]
MSDESRDVTSTASPLAVRGVMVEGQRLATAMSDAPRAFLARAPLVVLPAAGFGWEDYRPVLEHFAPERRVFAFDWPGFGASAKPSPSEFAYSTAHFADVLASWMDNVGIARAVFLGHGVGAAAAVRYAAAHPERVAGLCLIAPSGFASRGPLRSLAARLLGVPSMLRLVEPRLTSFALGPSTTQTTTLLAARRNQRSSPEYPTTVAAHAAMWHHAARPGEALTPLAKTVAAPTMIVRGALDPLFSAGDAERAAETFGERRPLVVTLPGAGHLPCLQAPDRFFQVVGGLLNTAEANAAVNN